MLALAGCQSAPSPPDTSGSAPPAVTASPTSGSQSRSIFPVRIEGTRFVDAAGRPFDWRGVTAFRLVEKIATGREAEAIAYLDWVKSENLTVVRVLAMGPTLYGMSPEAGRNALPKLLEQAKQRGIVVEIVALADTINQVFDYDEHVREIGRIAAAAGNGFVELANEPGHPTQDRRIHEPAFLARLRTLIPDTVPVALGSFEYGEGFAAGDYATTHTDRGRGEWDHVLAVAAAAPHVEKLKKPVVSDEPIGAGPVHQPGRRDTEPARFAAAAALTKLAGLGATFHYEGGLQASIPSGREAACFAAWQLGLTLVADAQPDGEFIQGERLGATAQTSGARAAFGRVTSGRAVVLLVDPTPAVSVKPAPGWKETRRSGVPGVQIVIVERGAS